MAKQARKPYRNNDLKKILPLKESIDGLEKTEKMLHAVEHDNLARSATAVESCCNILKQLGSNLPALAPVVEESEKAITTAYHIGAEMTEFCHKTASDMMLAARELMDCQSADQFYTVQQLTLNQLSKRWFEEVSRMSCMMAGGTSGFCVLPLD